MFSRFIIVVIFIISNSAFSKCRKRYIDDVKNERSVYFKAKVISSNFDKGMVDIYTRRKVETIPSHFEMKVEVQEVYKGSLKHKELIFKYPWIWQRKPGTQVFKKDSELILSLKDIPESNKVTEGFGYCGRSNVWFYFSKDSKKEVRSAVQSGSVVTPKGFKVVKPYPVNSSQRRCANYSKSLLVSLESNKLSISDYQSRSSRNSTLKVSEGEFQAKNHGEWGGGLKFVSKKKTEDLHDKNVSFVFKYGDKVLALGGLAHLRMDSGVIIEIAKSGDSWKVIKKHKLSSKPNSYTLVGDKVYIVTNKGISAFDNGELKTLWDSNYLSLYPNSLVVLNDSFYIGMRHAVVRIYKNEKNEYTEDWLVQKECDSVQGLEPVYK